MNPASTPTSPAAGARQAIRSGAWTSHTSGLAEGHVQANLVILPNAHAADFLLYCKRNPKPCPLLAVSVPGSPQLPELGADVDIRTDLPRYRVWRHGELAGEPTDIRALWQDDFVSFAIGCSFSFEQALLDAGLPVRHIEQNRNVPMYRTAIPTEPAGPFAGPMVVSMRPMRPEAVEHAIRVTARYPDVHGAPVHVGDPARIGIADLGRPDFGDAVDVLPGELPVFWACGVTPQAAIANARLPLVITHAPGAMLVTDLLNHELASE